MKQTNLFLASLLLTAVSSFAQTEEISNSKKEKEDEVTRTQFCDAFNSLEDGQPTPPGYVEFRLLPTFAYSKAEHQIIGVEPEVEYTPKSKHAFLENAQLLASFFLEHDGT